MSYNITPTSGINLDDKVATNPNSAGTGVPANGPLGSQVFGSDGKRYVLGVTGAAVTASTATCSINASTFVATVRPMVTYLFVIELFVINVGIGMYVFTHPGIINGVEDLLKISDEIFSDDEMAMLGAIIGYWFGSRGWAKK